MDHQHESPAQQALANAQESNSSLSPTELISLAGVLIGTLATFALTFTFGWVYDDPPQIPQNPNLIWSRFGFLLTHQLWASMAGAQERFYRPFLTFWFLINKTLFGLDPHYFHVTTVLAHVAATALAFQVARTVLKDTGAALFGAAIFAVHPLQAETASWISSVNDSLAALLCFASFLIYRKAISKPHRTGLWWTLAAILFLLALLTKEVSIVLVGIILVDLWLASGSVPPSSSIGRFLVAMITAYGAVTMFWLAL